MDIRKLLILASKKWPPNFPACHRLELEATGEFIFYVFFKGYYYPIVLDDKDFEMDEEDLISELDKMIS